MSSCSATKLLHSSFSSCALTGQVIQVLYSIANVLSLMCLGQCWGGLHKADKGELDWTKPAYGFCPPPLFVPLAVLTHISTALGIVLLLVISGGSR